MSSNSFLRASTGQYTASGIPRGERNGPLALESSEAIDLGEHQIDGLQCWPVVEGVAREEEIRKREGRMRKEEKKAENR